MAKVMAWQTSSVRNINGKAIDIEVADCGGILVLRMPSANLSFELADFRAAVDAAVEEENARTTSVERARMKSGRMELRTYRARHTVNGDIKYACNRAIDTSGYEMEPGPPEPNAKLFLCEDCFAKMEANPSLEPVRCDEERDFFPDDDHE